MKCSNPPMYRYTWPGKDEAAICVICAMRLANIANAIGLHLQLIALKPEEMIERKCSTEVKEEAKHAE